MTYDVLIPWADWLPGHLRACMMSLWSQTLQPDRIVIGDFGCQPLPTRDFSRYVRHVRGSPRTLWNRSAALNLAFRESSAPWVLVVDADTVLLDADLTRSLRLRAEDAAWAICTDPDGTPHENGTGGCLMVRREAWEKIGGYDEGYEGWGMEEHDFIERLKLGGFTVAPPLPAGRVLTLWHPRKTTAAMADAVLRNRARFRAKFGKD